MVRQGVHGAVAAGHPDTAAAAAELLADGGNAFDAALAGVFAACVCEPVLASLGGGGFLLAETPGGKATLFDFFAQTPRTKRPARELDFGAIEADFGTVTQEFHIGIGSIATPGLVAGLFDVHTTYGKAPMARIVEPAIRLAKAGVALAPLQAEIMDIVSPIVLASDSARALFESRKLPGKTLRTGEQFGTSDFADVLEALTREGADLFYKGDIAAEIAGQCVDGGGLVSRDDLADYTVIRRKPLETRVNGARFVTNPAPSSGGPLISFCLSLLAESWDGSGDWHRHLVEAMRNTNEARRASGMAEASSPENCDRLLSPPFMVDYLEAMEGRALKTGGTTHISVVDSAGNAAALSTSNGEGCGHILPGTGIMLNNMLGEEDINPQGFFEWTPDTRISSMMAPSLVEWPDGRRAVLGSGGSNRIRTAIVQVAANLLWREMSLEKAVFAPRVHFERGHLNIEFGHEDATVAGLTAAYPNHTVWPERNLFFGGVHTAARLGDSNGFEGAGDVRRGGVSDVI